MHRVLSPINHLVRDYKVGEPIVLHPYEAYQLLAAGCVEVVPEAPVHSAPASTVHVQAPNVDIDKTAASIPVGVIPVSTEIPPFLTKLHHMAPLPKHPPKRED